MRVDAHHHLWSLSEVYYPWLMAKGVTRFFGDPTPIQRDYPLARFRHDAAGFGASVHIQVGASDPWAEAQWVQSVADVTSDWPLVQVAFCDLTAPNAGAAVDRLQTLPSLRGLRQIVGRAPGEDLATGTDALLDNPAFAHGLRDLAGRGLTFDLQLIPAQYERMARVLDQAPDTQIALCHAGSPHNRSAQGLADWARQLKYLSERPNVVCKLSGLGMFDHHWTVDSIRPIVETCLAQFGPTRCMFGSNFPVDRLYSDYQSVTNAYSALISAQDHAAVFGTNALRFYRIDAALPL